MKPTILFSSLLILASNCFAGNVIMGQPIEYNDSTRSGSFTLFSPSTDSNSVANYETELRYFPKSSMIIGARLIENAPIPYMLTGNQACIHISGDLGWGEDSENSTHNFYPTTLIPFDNTYITEDCWLSDSKALYDYNIELNSFHEYEAESVRASDYDKYFYATDSLGDKFRFKVTKLNEDQESNFQGGCSITISWEAETSHNSGIFKLPSPINQNPYSHSAQNIAIVNNGSELSLTNGEALGSISLYDTRGRIVYRNKGIDSSLKLSSLNLAAGIYSIKIENRTTVITSKVIFR